jgi:hypothetical protein
MGSRRRAHCFCHMRTQQPCFLLLPLDCVGAGSSVPALQGLEGSYARQANRHGSGSPRVFSGSAPMMLLGLLVRLHVL